MTPEPLLEVRGLRTHFSTARGTLTAVDGVDFSVFPGEVYGLVGESGCGKSVTSLSIMRLVEHPGDIVAGEIRFEGEDLLGKSQREMARLRGRRLSMIFQQPRESLNPAYRIGEQVAEAFRTHLDLGKRAAAARAVELLAQVGLPDPAARARLHPHQLSGGQAQRVMIAMALALKPALLIADEPTTALDVTIQAQILELLRSLREETGTAIILVTHDLGVIAELADRVGVMYAGRLVEESDTVSLFDNPLHPYTQGLMASMPTLDLDVGRLPAIPGSVPEPIGLGGRCRFATRCRAREAYGLDIAERREPDLVEPVPGRHVRCWLYQSHEGHVAPLDGVQRRLSVAEAPRSRREAARAGGDPAPLVEVRDLVKHFPLHRGLLRRGGEVRAVDGVSFDIHRGETLSLVGESGCGKSTVGRTLLRLEEPTSGEIRFDGVDVVAASRERLRRLRRNMQMVFQDPYSSLDPRVPVGASIAEALRIHGTGGTAVQRRERVAEALHTVGLSASHAAAYPHEFSGGQRQRVGIARALVLRPSLLVLDEPVSALDVSIQAQVLNLLQDIQRDFDLTYLFVAHNLAVVRHVSDRVAVMYAGRLAEVADRRRLFAQSLHPYTHALIGAIPRRHPLEERERLIVRGDVPSPVNPPRGCRFHPRCPIARPGHCDIDVPPLRELAPGHLTACHYAEELR